MSTSPSFATQWTAQLGAQVSRQFGWGGTSPNRMSENQGAHSLGKIDTLLLWITVSLVALGLVMVYSSTVALADSPRYANLKPWHFLLRQSMALLFALVFSIIAMMIPLERWRKASPWLFVAVIVLLVLVLIPGIGKGVLGARRWLPLGIFNLQPSELMKLAVVLYAADYTVRKERLMDQFWKAFWPIAFAVFMGSILIFKEPDQGATMVIVFVTMGVLFLGGLNARYFAALVVGLSMAFMVAILTSPYRRDRLFSYLDPFEENNALEKSYQLSHALIAFGRGEWFGVGLGASIEKLHYLPEAHTDFLLAVIGEELGFVGVVAVIALFYFLVKRIFAIGQQAIVLEKIYAGLVAKGIGLWIALQALISIGVNTGALPTKGLTLPLMSYGGSGLVANLVALAIVLRVDYENRAMMLGKTVFNPQSARGSA